MEHVYGHTTHAGHHSAASNVGDNLNRISVLATLHCLMGCAIGEVAGMIIGTALGWSNLSTILLAVGLAYISGFALTILPLLRNGYAPKAAIRLALLADTASITIMELVDNAIMLTIPGAMDAPLNSWVFWASLSVALIVAGVAAFPVNRWLIRRGRGHALVHDHHQESR